VKKLLGGSSSTHTPSSPAGNLRSIIIIIIIIIIQTLQKDEVCLVSAIKAHTETSGTTPRILNLRTNWR
jgi:hypothetical protein